MASPYGVGSIATNTSEDYVDELTTSLVYKYSEYVFSGFDKEVLNKNDTDVMAEALEGAKQTLKFSIMNAVIFTVTEYAITRLVTVSGAIWLWVKKRRVINAVRDSVRKGLGDIPIVGGFLGRATTVASEIANGSQQENLAMAQMANHSANNVTSLIGQERQTQVNMQSSQRKQMLDTLGLSSNEKELRDNKKLEAYHYKMKTGTWENTTIDKNLFLSCVPREYIKQPFSFNTTFVTRLNSFTEFAKSAEGKLTNLAQSHLDLMTTHNLSQVN